MSRFAVIYEDPDYEQDEDTAQQDAADFAEFKSVDIPELDEIYSPYYGA